MVDTNESGEDSQDSGMTIAEKEVKIASNYETIEVLRARLEDKRQKKSLGMTRAAYIKMIFDVTERFDRQSGELNKIVAETRKLQRDISYLSGRLERSFKLVEETLLKDAKHDAWSRECYNMLVSMHENCDQLIGAVQETGELTREMRQLEDQVGQLRLARTIENS